MKNIYKSILLLSLALIMANCEKKHDNTIKNKDQNGSSVAKIKPLLPVNPNESKDKKPNTQKESKDAVQPNNFKRVTDGSEIVSERGTPFKDFATAKTYTVTDSSASALQNMINKANSDGGGIVYAYNGTIQVQESILMQSNIKLIGQNKSRIEHTGKNNDGVIKFRNVNNATIEKMDIDGGGVEANTAGIAVIYGGNDNIKISNNIVTNTGRNGISLYGNAPDDIKNVEISHNKISYCGVGYYKSAKQFNDFNSASKGGFHGIETRFTTDVLVASNDISYTDMGSELTTQTIRGEYIGNKVYHTGWGMKLVAIEDAIVRYNDFSGIIGNDDAVFYSDVYADQPYSHSATAWIEYNTFLGAKNGHKSVRLSDLGKVYFKYNETPDGVDMSVGELIEK